MLMKLILVPGMHPRVLVDGFEIAKRATLQFLEKFKTPVVMGNEPDKEILKMVARTTLRTKVTRNLSFKFSIRSMSWNNLQMVFRSNGTFCPYNLVGG